MNGCHKESLFVKLSFLYLEKSIILIVPIYFLILGNLLN